MALHLITGYAGTEHITSADQGAYNMGTFGSGEFVLNRGSKFAATVVSNNSITIANGEAMMQGRYIKLPLGTTESVSIDNGTSGMKRKDLIVLRYSKNGDTGVESVALAVIKGTPAASNPSDPSHTTGTITDGTDSTNDMLLYRVNIDGLTINSLDTLFSVKTSMVDYMDNYQLPNASVGQLGGIKIPLIHTGYRTNDGSLYIDLANNSGAGLVKPASSGGLYAADGEMRLGYIVYNTVSLTHNQGSISPGSGALVNATVPSTYTYFETLKQKSIPISIRTQDYALVANIRFIDIASTYIEYGIEVHNISATAKSFSADAFSLAYMYVSDN